MGTSNRSLTALFLTDVVGSTRLWQTHPGQMNAAMGRHHALVADIVAAHDGRLPVDQGEGDARFAAFGSSIAAVAAAVDLQRALATEPWPAPIQLSVRIGIHTGEVIERDGNLFGDPVNRCARIRGLAHGGQILLSGTTKALLDGWAHDSIDVLDLGEHRMKDLTEAVRIYQVTHPDLPVEFPRLASLNRAKHNLPVQLSSFIGRQSAIADVTALVTHHALVTITGFGGMGKTRLSLQVGAELADGDGDGIWFADLSAVRDTTLVAEAIARVLGIQTRTDPLQAVTGHLADKRLLLICDNLEQLLPDAAPIIAALAAAGPGVRVLVTSREPVGVRGEHVYPLPPLHSPGAGGSPETADSLGVYDAVTLFLDRASAADPTFTVDNSSAPAVAAICAAVDGWPLALELAAARVRMLGLPGLLSRLSDRLGTLTGGARDLPDRQRTLRETIAWSYDLLTPPEQTLLNRLSVFAGSATLTAVEAVCGPDLHADTLDTLTSLLDKSLVHTGEGTMARRFRLPETIRDYAGERLVASGEHDATRAAHAAYFVDLFPDPYHGPEGPELSAEVPNLSAALDTLLVLDLDAACVLFEAVDDRLIHSGHLRDADLACARLSAVPALGPLALAKLAIADAGHDYYRGKRAEVLGSCREATVLLLEQCAEAHAALRGCVILAYILGESGDGEAATAWATRSVEVAGWSGQPVRMADALMTASYVSRLAGRFAEAVEFAQRATEAASQADLAQQASTRAELTKSLVAADRGDEAVVAGEAAVHHARGLGGVVLAFALGAYGRALLAVGNAGAAVDALVTSTLQCRDLGVVPFEPGWAALALAGLRPDVGASLLGATDSLFAQNGDRELLLPDHLIAQTRALYEGTYREAFLRGRELGWPAVASLLEDLDLAPPVLSQP